MLSLAKSSFYNEPDTKRKLADFIVQTSVLSMSAECRKFEESFARKQGRKFAVFVTSGSAANLILIQSLLNLGRLKPGDRVGVSVLTWATNIMPLMQLGLVPVPLDCELGTLNISPRILAEHISSLQGLFITNTLGFCDNLELIGSLCRDHGIVLLEDNCEALGSETFGKLLGNFGLASTFSFFVGHHLSTIEGGMVCTDDEELYAMLVMTRAHGWDRNLPPERQQQLRQTHGINDFYAMYTFYDLAYNTRPTEIQGFLGNTQLAYWDEIVAKRQDNFRKFQQAMAQNSDFLPLNTCHLDTVSNFDMPVICKDKKTFERYHRLFTENDVEIRPIVAGDMTQQPFYRKHGTVAASCPHARFIHEHGFYFPNNAELTPEEVSFLCSLLTNKTNLWNTTPKYSWQDIPDWSALPSSVNSANKVSTTSS